MPRGDGTGPQGSGPLTGRKKGSCGSMGQSNSPVEKNQTFGGWLVSGIGRMLRYGQSKRGETGLGRRVGGQGRNK